MSQAQLKQQVATAALAYVPENDVLGVGTGSTINYFIKALATVKQRVAGAVASSEATARLLRAEGIPVLDLNAAGPLAVYIDGADAVTPHRQLTKGGGGALTREKIIAAASRQFVCLVDASKQVDRLGQFPIPVEVIPMARSYVGREILKLGGNPEYRQGFVTDNGNIILDIHGLDLVDPLAMEQQLNQITGVVSNGIFAARPADVVLIAQEQGITVLPPR